MESDKKQPLKSSDSSYLEKLTFNPKLRKTWLNFFVSNFRVVMLLIFILSAIGLYSFFQLPRESNPEVRIPIALINVVFPGASPSDVEELVTKKIETSVSSVSGINKITSTSANSFSSVAVEFEAGQDLDDSIRKLRDKLPSIRDEIPSDANDPQVLEISFDDTPIVTYSLTGPYDGFVMRKYADKIKDELEKIPGIRQVNVSGGDEKEFEIAYDPQKLVAFGINPTQANQMIAAANVAIPAGNFEGEQFNYPVRTDARVFDAKSLSEIPIFHNENGSIVFLKDIADVKETAIEKSVISRLSVKGQTPQNAVSLDIIKRTGGNIITTVDASSNRIEELLKTFPPGITYDSSIDQAKIIRTDFDRLTHDFLLTLALVMLILLLIVGLKEALVAGLAIPLVFFTTFGVMLASGISLNFLSIFSLLLSLGLLVDDAIVVVSATKQYMKSGKFTPEEAVLLVLNDFKVVLTSTTLATAWAFLPLLMSTGIIGQFIKSIPITVSVTLISSLLIALMINHPLAAVLERIRLTKKLFLSLIISLVAIGAIGAMQQSPIGYGLAAIVLIVILWMLNWYFSNGKNILIDNKKLAEREWDDDSLIKEKLRLQGLHQSGTLPNKIIHGIVHFDSIIPIYEKYLRIILQSKKSRIYTMLGTLGLFIFAISLPVTGLVKTEFFPPANGDTLFISLRGPAGLTLEQMDEVTKKVEEKLLKYPEVVNFSTAVGNPGPTDTGGSGRNSSNTSSLTLKLTDIKEREAKSYEIADKIRADLSEIQGAEISVISPEGGPPAGAAFQAQISGDDLQILDKVANDLKPILDSLGETVNSKISLKEAPSEYTFELDQAKMELYGVNAISVGSTLRMAISGVTVTTIMLDNKNIDVIANYSKDKLPDLQSIQNIQILNNQGQSVFLRDFSQIKLKPSLDSIYRIDQKRTVLLTADAKGEARSTQIVKDFQDKLTQDYKMPEGYSITYGGENEQNNESVLSIIKAMGIAAILIISTLIIQFNSLKKALIVLVTLPLALIGTFIGMAIFNVNLSFPGLIGILALFGIVVKNAIILIDKINLNIKTGIDFNDSIIDAGKSRIEAIFITSVCTIAGIIPITLSNELWTALGSAVIFGLSISSFFTLFIIPTLYMTFIDEKERF